MSVNKVMLIGNVGREPESKFMNNGNQVLNFSLATGKKWTDKGTGEMQERTTWHNIVIFGKMVDNAIQYIHKGTHLYVEGELSVNEYTKDGESTKRYTTSINCNRYELLSWPDKDEKEPAPTGNDQADAAQQLYKPNTRKPSLPGVPDFTDDDIPF